MTHTYSTEPNGFHIHQFHDARPFSSFLPGIAGKFGKPLWLFYTNRGQCVSSFGVRDKNGAMLEFHAANKAYVLTPLLGFRSFLRITGADPTLLYEPFQPNADQAINQRMCVRPHELEIEETNLTLGLRTRVVYFTLPGEHLPALVRRVTVENIGPAPVHAEVLDGLPEIVPFGLEERLLKSMSRTMEAFAEVRQVEQHLPFFKLKVEPSDKPDVQWIEGGFFTFTVHDGASVPVLVDPQLVFGQDTSLRVPGAFLRDPRIDAAQARRSTMTASAFAQITLKLAPGASSSWESYFGQAPQWAVADAFRSRVMGDAVYATGKRNENQSLITGLGERFALLTGPPQLDAYSRQAFLDNTMRGGQPVVIDGPHGPRVFHSFTRKHGDMERDYNFFELAPSYFSQGNGNFRDVNQNRRSENFTFPGVGASNIDTFFKLIQIDGNNPLVIESEKFRLPGERLGDLLQRWAAGDTAQWRAFLQNSFSPGQLMDRLVQSCGTPEMAMPWFGQIIGLCDKLQGATHGEGYWVDHWIYNLDLLQSYAALYPDFLGELLVGRADFTYFDNAYGVQPRSSKYVLRPDGSVRQSHAVLRDPAKAALIASRTTDAHVMRAGHGLGGIYRTTLLAKMVNLMVVKASLLDPFGVGLEMEAEKPGWCDALNGLPAMFGSSTHEAFALQRWVAFVRQAAPEHLGAGSALALPVEVADLVHDVTRILATADLADFHASWEQLAARREAFRATVHMGVAGDDTLLPVSSLLEFLAAVDRVLDAGLARAVDSSGIPVSYFTHELVQFDALAPPAIPGQSADSAGATVHVRARRFSASPVAAFLEGPVHALRSTAGPGQALALYRAVRASDLYDHKLGMYRVNAPLDAQSFEIGRSRIFAPGWLENESIFLHMHYKFLLETLRSGLAHEFFDDLRRGLVAFQDPAVYGRSPMENSSFIASSRFPDASAHGTGFVARLSGATAEWISMVLHMGLGAAPFRVLEGALRFEPRPVLAEWLFTTAASPGFGSACFGFKLFGQTWIVYENPGRRATYGPGAVAPVAFELHYTDGRQVSHAQGWLPEPLATDLRDQKLARLMIRLA